MLAKRANCQNETRSGIIGGNVCRDLSAGETVGVAHACCSNFGTPTQSFYPGVIVMVILFTTVFATMAVIEDRTQGFLQQMAVAPASRASMVLGKVAGVTTVAMVTIMGLLRPRQVFLRVDQPGSLVEPICLLQCSWHVGI